MSCHIWTEQPTKARKSLQNPEEQEHCLLTRRGSTTANRSRATPTSPDIQIADSILSEGRAGATASTTSLRALQNRLGSVNRCSRDAVLLKTRGGDPQLVSCKVAGGSHDVRESCKRANMDEKTASTAISSHEVPSLVPALRAHPTTSPPRSETPNGICHVCLRGGR